MPSEYSFLDVAVLDAVRQRFAAGDAIAILSVDLEQVIWANGPGAAVFGYPDIEAIIGASAQLPLIARRQIMATSGFPEIGSDRGITVRLATGMTSRTVGFQASAVTLPDGEKAIMLAVPAAQTGSRGAAEIANRAISGFTEDGHFIAFIDAGGNVEAASDGFSKLGIQPATLAALVADVAAEGERIVKRLVPGGNTSYPAGLARLTPERHLLVVIDEDQLEDNASISEASAEAANKVTESTAAQPDPHQDNQPTADVSQAEAVERSTGTAEIEPEPAPSKPAAEDRPERATQEISEPTGPTPVAADNDQPTAGGTPPQHDHWYFNVGEDDARPAPAAPEANNAVQATGAEAPVDSAKESKPASPAAQTMPPVRTIDRSAAPLRFVWRTDAEGKFSALSPEFADIVGKPAADVIGRRFRDVAAAFGLDASGEIAGLLERRDTWSGRSVLWPVVGTDLKIPVDLAALPVYGRSRAFEGFRGFGVARTGDAIVDPEAIGMALVPNGEQPATPEPEAVEPPAEEPKADESKAEEPDAADPFKGEVPALTIVPKQERRFADKVIRLAEHRQPANDKGLSTLERSAFREIGERLKKDSAPAEPPEADKPGIESPPKPEPGTPAEPAAETAVEAPAAKTETPIEAVSDVASTPDAAPDQAPAETGEIPVAEPESDAVPAEPSETDAEDEADLARLDGAHPDDVVRQEDSDTPAGATGSLLSYAEASPVADNDEPTASEPVPTESESAEPAAIDDEPAVAEAGHVGTDDDDSMTSADFRDAEDSEDWVDGAKTAAADEQAATFSGETAKAANAVGSPAERPRLKVPPLKTEGIVPSAFSVGDESKTPDTSLLGKLPVPLLIHSGDQLHYANEEFLDLTGYDTLDDLEDAGGLGALFADPYADDGASEGSDQALRLKTRDGQEFPIDAILRSVPWRDGKALMLVVRRSGDDDAPAALHLVGEEPTQPDISELKARIAEMRTIIDTATDGVVLIGSDGTIRSISRPAEALFGFDSDEVTGKPFASLFAIESQRAARDYLAGLSEPGVASVMNDGREVIGREAQGRFIPLFMTIGRLPNDSGFCAVVRDITQWKRAEEDLTQARAVAERASSQKTDFLARISHEIRTPLNAIIGFSELMVDEKFGPVANDRYRDYLRDINRSGNHVLDLVNDLLDISKIEAGQQEMAYEAVSLNDTLAETVAMMQPQANRERVIIRSSFASRLPEVVADLRSVRQIALNILSNAIRYTQAGGQVIVSTAYETSGDVVMRVRDTGIGMSQAEIEQALKPFKQINALKRGRGDGTGLGLPLTKAMVEANRARFTINSTPGEGTLVEVAFPSTRVLAE
ncbi:PAS domain S-box protein [Mesorhizobium loti]|uniref:histidine kinase n=1 Tax=Mesorhizobium jarvisii TaxID=1777867 RepID=A0A6M7TH52_9HYPH|nr:MULTISPECIES: PAS domain S-box protein [Mesorhizobium]OBQ58021.1 PAS domain-containing sensor histidine kinase [Mesorhizobium loti]QKC63133.1 PAS domain S-box protein [Mesorhizobium jarvisii]QKD09044.1 PAS domain S-box protein [Mesorhizobium loti]RJT30140.1 PAS domain S-box protein [Mesorhizobium jarvisii]BCH04060.1 ATPase [Mesorhizobium sp. 131-2-5]